MVSNGPGEMNHGTARQMANDENLGLKPRPTPTCPLCAVYVLVCPLPFRLRFISCSTAASRVSLVSAMPRHPFIRMGKDGVHPGTAYTLVTPKQATFAGELAYHLEASSWLTKRTVAKHGLLLVVRAA